MRGASRSGAHWSAAALLALLSACSSPEASPDEAPPEGAPEAGPAVEAPSAEDLVPVVDEEAEAVMRRVGAALAGAERYSFRVETTRDEFLASGQSIEVSSDVRVFVRRPGCLRVESISDRGRRLTQFDGTHFGMADLTRNVHVEGSVPSPLSVEQLLDTLSEEYGVHVPLADLLTDNPYEAIAEDLERAVYVGKSLVRGVACDHLAGTSRGIDWQVWVPAAGPSVPARVTLESSGEDGSERFSAYLSDWNLSDSSADAAFQFAAPPGSRRIRMARHTGTETATAEGGAR